MLSCRGELRFEVGDALVVEREVLPCGLELLLEGAVAGGEGADALLERGVLSGDPPDGFLGPLGLLVADLAEEFADAGALDGDLMVGGLERVLGVQCPLAPGGLGAAPAVRIGDIDQTARTIRLGTQLLDGCGVPPRALRCTRLATLVNTIDPK